MRLLNYPASIILIKYYPPRHHKLGKLNYKTCLKLALDELRRKNSRVRLLMNSD